MQYITSKLDEYGMKMVWITHSETIYPLKAKAYLGREGRKPERNLGQKVVT